MSEQLSGNGESGEQRAPGWQEHENELERVFTFSTFPDGVAFVNRVADLAEEAEHHPDIMIQYTQVTLRLSTHTAGRITDKDFDLARRINALLQ